MRTATPADAHFRDVIRATARISCGPGCGHPTLSWKLLLAKRCVPQVCLRVERGSSRADLRLGLLCAVKLGKFFTEFEQDGVLKYKNQLVPPRHLTACSYHFPWPFPPLSSHRGALRDLCLWRHMAQPSNPDTWLPPPST